MYSDTLDMDFSFDVPVRRPALLSRKMFNIPVHPMDAKWLNARCYEVVIRKLATIIILFLVDAGKKRKEY